MNSSPALLINDNLVSHAWQRGVSRYLGHIVEAAQQEFGDALTVCAPAGGQYRSVRMIHSPRFRGSRRLGVQDTVATLAAFMQRPAVFYSAYFGTARSPSPQVFTVYDMIHELLPEHFVAEKARTQRFIAQKKRCFERATTLLAISQSTADDIIACYPELDRSKIVVIPLGVDEQFFASEDQHSETAGKPFLLYVGQRAAYKNFLALLSAFGQCGLANDFDLRVISPAASRWTVEEVDLIQRFGLQSSAQLIPAAGEAQLRWSYQHATAFVYPSLYEGFGLPVLEAMASGTLTAVSQTSSMPEVGGDVALYFDPTNIASMVDCLTQVARLSDSQRRERSARGIIRAREFSWQRCQQATMTVLKTLSSKH